MIYASTVDIFDQFSRSGKAATARPVRAPKDNLWKENIARAVLECAHRGLVPDVTVPADPNIAFNRPKSEMSKEALVQMFQTRMNMRKIDV